MFPYDGRANDMEFTVKEQEGTTSDGNVLHCPNWYPLAAYGC